MSNILQLSTNLAAALCTVGSLKDLLDGGVINIYAGTKPADADAVKGGATLLRTITLDGDGVTGLTFDPSAPNGVLKKPTADAWESEASPAASGTAVWWRYNSNISDDNSAVASSTNYRIQGDCATDASGSLFLPNLALSAGVQTVLATVQLIVQR